MQTHSQHLFQSPPPSPRSRERVVAIVVEPFALWLAEHRDPSLRRTPLVACAEGRVAHANAAARRKGIERGMQLTGARLRAATLVEAASDEPTLRAGWDALVRELLQRTPWVDGGRRGRLLARLSEREARELATELHARVGVADDLQSAELCALASPLGEARSLDTDERASFLQRLPLRFLRGIGLSDGDLTRLQWLGVRSAGELASWRAEQLHGYLGDKAAAVVHYLKGPLHTTLTPYAPPVVLRRSLSFERPSFEPADIDPALDRLARSLALALALEGRAAQHLTLIAERGPNARHATRQAKTPLRQARQILQQARFALRDSGAAPHGIDTLILELGAPQSSAEQGGLWRQREQREEALHALLERYPQSVKRPEWRDPFAPSAEHSRGWVRWDAEPPRAPAGTATPNTHRTPALKSAQSPTEPLPPMDASLPLGALAQASQAAPEAAAVVGTRVAPVSTERERTTHAAS